MTAEAADGWWVVGKAGEKEQSRWAVGKAGEKEATLSLLSDSPTSNYQTRQRTPTAHHAWVTPFACIYLLFSIHILS